MKSVVLFVVMSICSIVVFSQTKSIVVETKLKFGFIIGASYSNLQSKEPLPDYAQFNNGIGFKTGLLMEYAFTKNLLFSPKAELSFNNCSVDLTYRDNSVIKSKIFPTCLEIMAHFVYKMGNGKTTPYFLLGPNLKMSLAKKGNQINNFNTKPDCALDFGIGLDNRIKHFSFAPEIRYSFGLFNVNNNPAFPPINYHSISLVMNFR